MFIFNVIIAFIFSWYLMICCDAQSAEMIEEGPGILKITGSINSGDSEKFGDILKNIKINSIDFDSLGGKILPALEIGEEINKKGIKTIVKSHSTCASACALIWLAGREREAEQGAKIGFHAAYVLQGNNMVETGAGNALVGAYLTRLGLAPQAIVFATRAAPRDMQWLNERDAERVGISYKITGDKNPSSINKSTISLNKSEWRESLLMDTTFRLFQSENPMHFEDLSRSTYEIYQKGEPLSKTIAALNKQLLPWFYSKIKYFDDEYIVFLAEREQKILAYALKNDVNFCRNDIMARMNLPSDFGYEIDAALRDKMIASIKTRKPIEPKDINWFPDVMARSIQRVMIDYKSDIKNISYINGRPRSAVEINAAIENPKSKSELKIVCALSIYISEELRKHDRSEEVKFYRFIYQNAQLKSGKLQITNPNDFK